MAAKDQKSFINLSVIIVVVIIIICCSLPPFAECLKKQAAAAAARKEDIPFIKCQVCQKLASQLHSLLLTKQPLTSPNKISEYEIIEIVENVCNLKKEEADWIFKIDIVEQGHHLELVDQAVEGKCNSECKTIERACQEVLEYSDTDVAEYIYSRRPQLDSLVNYLCKDLSKACTNKPPPVPKDRIPGESFEPKAAKEAEMEKIMRSMEGLPGAPGMKMYSRDELMDMQNLNGKEADEDDEDEDDDEDVKFRSNVGKAFREKAKKEADWKEKVNKHVEDAGKKIKTQTLKIKRQAHKLKHRLQKWWRSKNTAGSTKKKSASKIAEL